MLSHLGEDSRKTWCSTRKSIMAHSDSESLWRHWKKASTTKHQKLKNIIKSKHICTVGGYIRVAKQNVSQDIVDLILFFYAEPIMMNVKYKSQIKCIFYSPMEPEWDTLKTKICQAYYLNETDVIFQ
eukprot:20552_1